MKQVWIPMSELPKVMTDVSNGNQLWTDILTAYPIQEQKEEAKQE